LPNAQAVELSFTIEVLNTFDHWIVKCAVQNNCKLRYHRNYTPYLLAVTPSQVSRDDWMQFHLNTRATMDTNGTPADAWPFREARLGETLIDWEPTVQQTTRFA
jgi:hypothetical protein